MYGFPISGYNAVYLTQRILWAGVFIASHWSNVCYLICVFDADQEPESFVGLAKFRRPYSSDLCCLLIIFKSLKKFSVHKVVIFILFFQEVKKYAWILVPSKGEFDFKFKIFINFFTVCDWVRNRTWSIIWTPDWLYDFKCILWRYPSSVWGAVCFLDYTQIL